MKTNWERMREHMLRPEINKIVEKEVHTAQDACDLKILLRDFELSCTCQMFDEEFEKGHSEVRAAYDNTIGRRYSSYAPSHYDDRSGRNYDNHRYYSGVSGHNENQMFANELRSMLDSAQTDSARKVLEEAINNLHH